jgi:hypothetical protein
VVNAALSLGGLIGVILSGGFVYWEVGRYAAPQVARSRFDERREVFAYTAGLFVGVPLAIPLLFYFSALAVGAWIPSAVVDLALLLAGTEVALFFLLRSRYFGADASRVFYGLGFRAGHSGILTLALIARFLSSVSSVPPDGLALVLAQSVAVVAIEVSTAILALGRRGPLGSVVFGAAAFVLLGFGATAGALIGVLAAAFVVAGAIGVYRRLKPDVLGTVPSIPSARGAAEADPTGGGGRYRRTDREPTERP